MKPSVFYSAFALSLYCLPLTPALAETSTHPATTEPNFRFIDPNPAGTANYGWGRFRLPSVRIDIGSSFPVEKTLQDFSNLGKTINSLSQSLLQGQTLSPETASNAKNQINSALSPFQNGARIDYETEIGILSFAGAPLPALQIANRPISLGFHVGAETRGYLNAKFSKEFSTKLTTLTDSLPQLLTTGSNIAGLTSNAGQLTGQVTQLTGNITQLTSQGASLLQNPMGATPEQIQQLSGLVMDVSGGLDQIIQPARQLTKAVSDTTKTAQDLLNTIQGAADGGVSIESANDLHMTLAISGAYPVYETDDIKISVGTHLKLFLMPFNVPFRTLGLNSDSSLMGQIKVTEFSGFKNLSSLQSTLTSLGQAASDVDKLITQAETVKNQLDTARQNITTGNLNEVASQGISLVSSVNETSQSLIKTQQSINTAVQNVSGIQKTLTDELQQASLKGSVVTPGGAGFGMDLGVNAVLFRNLHLNLWLQNPIVAWQGTERPFEIRLADSTGQLRPNLNFQDNQAKTVNYNATVPFAVFLNGRYSFDELLPNFQGLSANSQFEFVNNGRTPALTLGVQKQFGPAYAGLGGRLGGITSMLYGEAGLRLAGNFGLDLQVGISPTGTGIPVPGSSWLNSALLGMYLQF